MFKKFFMFVSICLMSGCTAIFTTDGRDGALATDRRGSEEVLMDTALELRIRKHLKESPLVKQARVNVYSFNRHVLLLGQAQKSEQIELLSSLVAKQEGVRKIYNEVTVAHPITPLRRLQDSWITTKIKTSLYSRPKIKPWGIQVITEDGIVYLIGIVKPSEEDVAVEIARTTDGVKKVVKIFDY